MPDSPELAAAKRLLDAAKDRGFTFERIALGKTHPYAEYGKAPAGWTKSTSVGYLADVPQRADADTPSSCP